MMFIAAVVIVLILGAINPFEQSVTSSNNKHGYDSPVTVYDSEKNMYFVVRDEGLYLKFSIPFVTPTLQWRRIESEYKYNLSVMSSDGIPMNAEITYYATKGIEDDEIKRNAQKYGLDWQSIMAHRDSEKQSIEYATTHTADDLFRNGYKVNNPHPIAQWSVLFITSYTFVDKEREVALRARIMTDSAPGGYSYERNYDYYADEYGVPTSGSIGSVANTPDARNTWKNLQAKHPGITENDAVVSNDGDYYYTWEGNQKGYRVFDETDYSKYMTGGVESQADVNAIMDEVLTSS